MAAWTGMASEEMIQPDDCAEVVRLLLRLSPRARIPQVVIERLGSYALSYYIAPHHSDAVYAGFRDGTVDIMATDHAPHLREEKEPGWTDGWKAHTGTPSEQFYLSLLLTDVAAGKLGVAPARNIPIPLGWVLDKEGRPTTNANDYYEHQIHETVRWGGKSGRQIDPSKVLQPPPGAKSPPPPPPGAVVLGQ